MLETGTPKHLAEWQAFYEMEPFGQDWHKTSRATASIINQIRASTPREKPIEEGDFLADDFLIPKPIDQQEIDAEIEAKLEAADSIGGLGV